MSAFRASLLLLLGACLPAAELVIRDVGVSLGTAPSEFSYDIDNSAGSRSGDDSFDTMFELEGTGRYSFAGTGESWGLVAGGGLAVQRAGYAQGGGWLATEVRGSLGVGWAVNDRLTLIGEGVFGIGIATLHIDGGDAFPESRLSGRVLAPGARAVALWTFSEQWYGSLSAGMTQTRGTLSGDGSDLTLTSTGFTGAIGIVWRFSARPALLE